MSTLPASVADKVKRITQRIISLPTLPTVVARMIELVDNPKTSAISLARLIATDQALTARLLKLANSAYYGFPREISTVDTAIVILGFNSVKEMGLSLSVLDVFKTTSGETLLDGRAFWEHSIGCGVASRMFARTAQPALAGEAFVAGLLHDLGKIVLSQYLAQEFSEVLALAKTQKVTYDEAENQVLGCSHAEIGSWLAEKWRLPALIASCIKYHHLPSASLPPSPIAAMVSLADYICHTAGIGASARTEPPPLDDRVWDLCQSAGLIISQDSLDDWLAKFLFEFDESHSLIAMLTE